jgi:hypothetical protein
MPSSAFPSNVGLSDDTRIAAAFGKSAGRRAPGVCDRPAARRELQIFVSVESVAEECP